MSDILARGGDYVQYCTLTESSGSYTLSTQPTISTEYDSNWVIQGVGHFNQSEEDPRLKRDIVWRNTSTGANRVWIIESGSVASVHSLPSESTSSGWVMAAFTKFDEDNVCDIIWTNSSGQVRVWTLNSDFTLKGTITGLPTVVPQSWHGWQIASRAQDGCLCSVVCRADTIRSVSGLAQSGQDQSHQHCDDCENDNDRAAVHGGIEPERQITGKIPSIRLLLFVTPLPPVQT